ncbi:unnamed protein product [Sphagnum jensenii]
MSVCFSKIRRRGCGERRRLSSFNISTVHMSTSLNSVEGPKSKADLSLQEETAEGRQANVFFAAYDKFSTPVVVKRLKYEQVDLLKLRRRMDKVMRLVREHSSAICRVMGVGTGNLDNAWILMERMGGDLRNFIDHGVRYVGYVDDGHGWAYAV